MNCVSAYLTLRPEGSSDTQFMMSSSDHMEDLGQTFRRYQGHIATKKLFVRAIIVYRREMSFLQNLKALHSDSCQKTHKTSKLLCGVRSYRS